MSRHWPGGRLIALVFALCLAGGEGAGAVTLDKVRHLFEAGNFRAAAIGGADLGSPDALAVAARARLVRAAELLPPDQARNELDQAAALARTALTKDPDHVEAALHLAIALGYRARIQGHVTAHFNGIAAEARRYIDRALKARPDSAWAHAVSGAWHAEIVVGGGPDLADSLYNASREKALRQFETAVKLAPDNIVIRLEYAKALIKLRGRNGWTAAERQLTMVATIEPAERLERIMQDKAAKLARALDTDDPKTVRKTLRAIEPFAGE